MTGVGAAVFACCLGCVIWAMQGDDGTSSDDEFRARHGFADRKDVEWAAYSEAMRRVYGANNSLLSKDHLLGNPVDVSG